MHLWASPLRATWRGRGPCLDETSRESTGKSTERTEMASHHNCCQKQQVKPGVPVGSGSWISWHTICTLSVSCCIQNITHPLMYQSDSWPWQPASRALWHLCESGNTFRDQINASTGGNHLDTLGRPCGGRRFPIGYCKLGTQLGLSSSGCSACGGCLSWLGLLTSECLKSLQLWTQVIHSGTTLLQLFFQLSFMSFSLFQLSCSSIGISSSLFSCSTCALYCSAWTLYCSMWSLLSFRFSCSSRSKLRALWSSVATLTLSRLICLCRCVSKL